MAPFMVLGIQHIFGSKKMPTKKAKNLAKQLRNIGPTLAAKLIEARIDTPEKLRQIGSKKAFEKMYATGDSYGDFNAAYLYALEGAIQDCDWLEIPEKVKRDYKKYAQELQAKRNKKGT